MFFLAFVFGATPNHIPIAIEKEIVVVSVVVKGYLDQIPIFISEKIRRMVDRVMPIHMLRVKGALKATNKIIIRY